MIRFICPELEGKSPSQMILSELQIQKSSSVDQWTDPNGDYIKYSHYAKGIDIIHNYINTSALYTQNSYVLDKAFKTIASFATYTGLTIANYTGLSSETIQFNVRTVDDLTSGYFYTIFTETGVIFTKPVRQSTSVDRGVITELISKTEKSDQTIKHFEYPTNAEYLADTAKWIIGSDINTITPAVINSTWKQLANNKAKSKTKTITFVSGVEMNALDYVRHNLDIYIVMSRVTLGRDLYQYTAVFESNDTWTINGQDYYKDVTKVDVYQNNTVTLVRNTFSTNIFDVETYDSLGEYNNSTGVFVPKTTKICTLSTGVSVVYGITAGKLYICSIYKDGTEFKRFPMFYTTTANHLLIGGAWTGEFVSGSSYAIRVYHNEAANNASFGGAAFNYMTINEIRG